MAVWVFLPSGQLHVQYMGEIGPHLPDARQSHDGNPLVALTDRLMPRL